MSQSVPIVASLFGVSHRYRDVVAVNSVTIDIPAGQMVGFIGPDGVGKSTLFGVIAGARKIQSGTVTVLGRDIGNTRIRKNLLPRIAYMPQGLGRNLYMDLTVAENLDFFGMLFGQGQEERRARIDTLLAATGLSPFPDRPAGKLSGGMKQKLGLCCALIHDPDLLILDEPTTGVDPLSRRQFWDLIDNIRRQRSQMSVLVATAYMEEAERFDWLVAMDDGKILATGSPSSLKESTQTETLDNAYIALLPTEKQGRHEKLVVPPYQIITGDGHVRPVITARHLTQKFGDFVAVDNVSFEILPGEIFGFLGSNGCGKTTTMKMLTGLLPASEGEARIFGKVPAAGDLKLRRRVGYMSQAFSLYSELTVFQNLDLHADLFDVPATKKSGRIAYLLNCFGLDEYRDILPSSLPLGVRQRLSLAVAVVHEPEMLILDEPTSGVDPVARDDFWRLLVALAREQKTTIFISTHFMNEGMRCDRIALMHAGRVLACDAPQRLIDEQGKSNLEETFITYMETAAEDIETGAESLAMIATQGGQDGLIQSAPVMVRAGRRMMAYTMREAKELSRDTIRSSFAFFGTMILMLVFGFGITFDVENLTYAVLDRDQTPESRLYAEGLSGSRYFTERPELSSHDDMDRRLKSGNISLAVEIPPDFGKDLLKGNAPVISAWVDGAMPFRAETIGGYMQGLHLDFIQRLYHMTGGERGKLLPVSLHSRFRYNQEFKSVVVIVPSVIALMLLFIPSILSALSVVREKELGSITNLYVTPVSKFEFIVGKQIPYVVVAIINFFLMCLTALFVFDVPVKGSFMTLFAGAVLYSGASTAMGLFFSAFTRTQIAALAVTAIMTLLPAIQFSGLMQPVSSLEGIGAMIGQVYPAAHFTALAKGIFAKDVGLAVVWPNLAALGAAWILVLGASIFFLKKQED